MSDKIHRGLSAAILTMMTDHPGRLYDANRVRQELNGPFRNVERRLIGAGLSYLARHEQIERVGHGVYKAGEAHANGHDDPEAVIDQLLDVMAAAEPVLRKAKRVMAALREAK